MIFGIDATKIPGENTLEKIKVLFHYINKQNVAPEIKVNQITNDMIHLSFPQYNKDGIKTEKLVQVDILLTDYPDFCKFYMYSPALEDSKYKGAHRNDLLRAILYTISHEIINSKNNEPTTWKQYDLAQDGLYYETKTIVDSNRK